jgi:tetratricopeptide (TPR) repeat protein
VALLGGAIGDEGDVERAQQLFEESVLRFRELGDRFYTLAVNRSLAWTYEELGDLDRARALHEDNLRQARATGNERVEARALGQLASLALDEGRGEDAVSMLREAYRIDHDHGDVIEIAFDLCRLARVLVLAFEGGAVTAARLLSSSEALRQEVGAAFPPWVAEMNEETLTTIRAQLDDAVFAEAWEEGRTPTPDAAVAHALDSLD